MFKLQNPGDLAVRFTPMPIETFCALYMRGDFWLARLCTQCSESKRGADLAEEYKMMAGFAPHLNWPMVIALNCILECYSYILHYRWPALCMYIDIWMFPVNPWGARRCMSGRARHPTRLQHAIYTYFMRSFSSLYITIHGGADRIPDLSRLFSCSLWWRPEGERSWQADCMRVQNLLQFGIIRLLSQGVPC